MQTHICPLGLDGLSLGTGAPVAPAIPPTTPPITAGKESSSASLLEDLGGIFSNTPNSSSSVPVGPSSLHTAMAPTLVPQPMAGILGAGILCFCLSSVFVLQGNLFIHLTLLQWLFFTGLNHFQIAFFLLFLFLLLYSSNYQLVSLCYYILYKLSRVKVNVSKCNCNIE